MSGPPDDLIEAGNVDLQNRPRVQNSDGSVSTVRSMSFEEDGSEVLVPTVSPDGRILSDDDAIKLYHESGQHLGKFRTADAATAYAEKLHDDQAKLYGLTEDPWKGRFPDPAKLPKSSSDGPETWGEAFGRLATASDETQRVIENVVADDAARYDAYAGYIKEVQDATGVKLANPLDVDLRQGAFDAKPNPQISGGTGLEWRDQKLRASLDKFEADRERWAAQYPAQSSVIQLDVEGRVKRQQRAAEAEQARAAQSPEL
ncbi:hypothetical protein MOV76_39110, partial [Rhizobium sp. PRIMUS64]|uniref:hypothetical protein n=1 Tax=Rhizobium sp. PRIMUS64 TaxID=2908925 RepID=UPI001FF6732E